MIAVVPDNEGDVDIKAVCQSTQCRHQALDQGSPRRPEAAVAGSDERECDEWPDPSYARSQPWREVTYGGRDSVRHPGRVPLGTRGGDEPHMTTVFVHGHVGPRSGRVVDLDPCPAAAADVAQTVGREQSAPVRRDDVPTRVGGHQDGVAGKGREVATKDEDMPVHESFLAWKCRSLLPGSVS